MDAQWQSRTRGSTRPWQNIAQPGQQAHDLEYRVVQVVDAARRGDACYAGRTGFFWHRLDRRDWSIVEGSLRGPFPMRAYAERDALRARSEWEPRQQRQLKDVRGLRIVSVTVVNETPGSRREISVEDLPGEVRRMGGERLAAALDGAGLGRAAG